MKRDIAVNAVSDSRWYIRQVKANLTEVMLVEGASVGEVESPVDAGLMELVLAE